MYGEQVYVCTSMDVMSMGVWGTGVCVCEYGEQVYVCIVWVYGEQVYVCMSMCV